MAIERVKNTILWKEAFGDPGDDQYVSEKNELVNSFAAFRSNVATLVARIAADMPGLTQHDITHLDALWETASLICGQGFPLNPLEAFVFGGAVLLHDSALSFEAYEGGVEAIRNTVVWRDHEYALSKMSSPFPIEELKSSADFLTLRSLHAEQAAKLVELDWVDPETKQSIYLIENNALRKHLGNLIGLIASSHHWNIEDVSQKLPEQVNALTGYPREWRIDPIKIACILRCADAAHFDNERAPDFLHALLKRRGESFHHWSAQNKMSKVDLDQADQSGQTLLFSSTRSFREEEADSWWICYDTICMIDKELKSSNALLESRRVPSTPFQVKKVKGAGSLEAFSRCVQTEGWTPYAAEVHVGNVEALVQSLGGEQLYGAQCKKVDVVLRELIQNSRDAIQARRVLEPDFTGAITVRLKSVDGVYVLSVEDDGVGMSKRVLTGPLLDFGSSFWASSLVQKEFPGLRSSGFNSVGRFGVGFYSVFMVASEVQVFSRPWTCGVSEYWQLHFKKGLSLRPILKNVAPSGIPASVSTQVALRIFPDLVHDGQMKVGNYVDDKLNIRVAFSDYVGAICAGLDVPVYFSENDSRSIEVHPGFIDDANKHAWLRKISFSEYRGEKALRFVEMHWPRLRPIEYLGNMYGMAAIQILPARHSNFWEHETVGGISTNIHGGHRGHFIGFIDFQPDSARRGAHKYSVPQECLNEWANEQLSLLDIASLLPIERYGLAANLAIYDVDPIDVALIPVAINEEDRFLSFAELAELCTTIGVGMFISRHSGSIEIYHTIDSVDGYALIKPIDTGQFLSLRMEEERPALDFSILGCLWRAVEKAGKKVHCELKHGEGRSPFGSMDLLLITTTG